MKLKVNDVHVHLGSSSIINQKLLVKDIKNFRKKYNIDNIMLFTLDRDIDKNNKKVIELAKKYEYVHGLYWIQKTRIKEDVKILEQELGNGLVGVKFHGVFEKEKVSAKIYEPIMKVLDKKKAILLIHCGRFKDGSPLSNSSFVHGLTVAKKFQNIKVILAHMGGNDTSVVRKALESAKNIPNAYFDTSGISTPFRVELGIKKVGPKRIIFGSDFPWCSFRGMFYGVEDALISKHAKSLILNKNFLRLISKN
ncbi:amidohydrolase family protein [Nitrosopumilus sp.]|uniref:amidohydrolase family protein n=1 Tax=Nitrosopumilus sp. TaxID=2024843 RepID=UPI002603FCFB|nr:amidohydrolase family protein [Nitrosopumilus sp.]